MTGWALTSHAQRYEIDHGRVFFGDKMLVQADAHSFKDLGYGYAKDRQNVYMFGRVLENVDPSSFRLKKKSTWRQNDSEYDYSQQGEWMGPESQRGYYKTKWNVYFGNKKIDAIASSFEDLGCGYARDAFNVFYYGERVDGAWAKSFKQTGNGYGEDQFNVYYRGRKIE